MPTAQHLEVDAIERAKDRARTYLTANGHLTTEPEVNLIVAMLLEFYHQGQVDCSEVLAEKLGLRS